MGGSHLAILLLFLTNSMLVATEPRKVPVTFHRSGRLATGLCYATLRSTIDFRRVRDAHTKLEKFLLGELLTARTQVEKDIFASVRDQFTFSTRLLDRWEQTFFGHPHHRQQRQLMPGLGLGFGIFGLGLSIYNSIELKKLNAQMSRIGVGFNHVLHSLDDMDHAVDHLAASVDTIKQVVSLVVSQLRDTNKAVDVVQQQMILATLVTHHTFQVSLWGEGLESLLNGRLHPTLIQPTKLQKGINLVCHSAQANGLRCLSTDSTSIFKAPLSYLTDAEKKLSVFLHIALIEREPLELYQHLPAPFALGKLTVTLKSDKEFIATDALGTYGIELSSADLSHCHVLTEHSGNLFACSDMNLMRRNPRNTCLGSLLFGSDEALTLCSQAVEAASDTEYARQISDSTLMVFQASQGSVTEQCINGTRNQRVLDSGISFISTSPGCRLITQDHIFSPRPTIEEEQDFIEASFDLDLTKLVPDNADTSQLELAHEQLTKIQDPTRRDLSKLRAWVQQNDMMFSGNLGLGAGVGALLLSGAILTFILALYLTYKRSKRVREIQG